MFKSMRRIYINGESVKDVHVILNENGIYNVSIGNCGWKKAKYCWFVYFRSNAWTFAKIMTAINKQGIKTYPNTIGY